MEIRFVVERKPMIEVDGRYCKGCGICVHFCPRRALAISSEINSRGFHVPYFIEGVECSKCGQCMLYCPDFAIFIVEED
jgi:2-oxoglutarate ferredoxin oxidoreductase subunit delta